MLVKKLIKHIIFICLVTQFSMIQIAIADCCIGAKNSNFYAPQYSDEDLSWARNLAKSGRDMVFQDLKEKFNRQEKIDNTLITDIADIDSKRLDGLYVFVSFSMPKPLLQNYLKEAAKYNAILVFKGLPNGSFLEFNQRIMDLIGEDQYLADSASVQIDDEAFDRYLIARVPTIILTQDDRDAWVHNNETQLIYDKITGNIGIKYALEQFSNSGGLSNIASQIYGK